MQLEKGQGKKKKGKKKIIIRSGTISSKENTTFNLKASLHKVVDNTDLSKVEQRLLTQ